MTTTKKTAIESPAATAAKTEKEQLNAALLRAALGSTVELVHRELMPDGQTLLSIRIEQRYIPPEEWALRMLLEL